jgi:hypothetical protein
MSNPKVRRAAALLIEREGPGVFDVAMRRVRRCASRRDREGARVWRIIAEEIAAMRDRAAAVLRAAPTEPRLDVPDDLATKVMMEVDRARRDELDSIIRLVIPAAPVADSRVYPRRIPSAGKS